MLMNPDSFNDLLARVASSTQRIGNVKLFPSSFANSGTHELGIDDVRAGFFTYSFASKAERDKIGLAIAKRLRVPLWDEDDKQGNPDYPHYGKTPEEAW